jgi:hypothetical protein
MTVLAVDNGTLAIQLTTSVVLYVLTAIGYWGMFRKAGVPGWWGLIPIFSTYVYIKIAGLHGATILLLLIPIVNIVFAIVLGIRVARSYGRGPAWGVLLLWLVGPIGVIITGWDSSRYEGPDLARS